MAITTSTIAPMTILGGTLARGLRRGGVASTAAAGTMGRCGGTGGFDSGSAIGLGEICGLGAGSTTALAAPAALAVLAALRTPRARIGVGCGLIAGVVSGGGVTCAAGRT